MQGLKIPEKLKKYLQVFTRKLKETYGQDLISVILYGSAVSNEFIDKHSNLNLLVALKNTDLENLKKASGLVNKFGMIQPLFLSPEYISSSTDIFPIEFLDMQENYLVLYGKDILKEVNIDLRNLRFQCEQELKLKLLTLKQAYLIMNKDRRYLRALLFKFFTSAMHILRNVLRLKGKSAPYKKEDIIRELAVELQIDPMVWEKILAAKNKKMKINDKDIDGLFINFARELEKAAGIVDKL